MASDRRVIVLALLLVGLVVLLFIPTIRDTALLPARSTTALPFVAKASPSPTTGTQTAAILAVETRIRVASGLMPLSSSIPLTASAQTYAATMARDRFFGHIGLDGSTLVTRDEAAGYRGWSALGEILAAGQTSAPQIVSSWMASPDHYAVLTNTTYTETGIGYVNVPGSVWTTYTVQEFGTRRP